MLEKDLLNQLSHKEQKHTELVKRKDKLLSIIEQKEDYDDGVAELETLKKISEKQE